MIPQNIRKVLILSLFIISSLFLDDCNKRLHPSIDSNNQVFSIKNYYVAITGNEHFFFLPPLASTPSPTGTFASNLAPVVQICKWTGTGCEFPPIAEFTTNNGKSSERVKVVPAEELYIVNWNTKRFGLNLNDTYRIRVLLRIEEKVSIEIELGHLDVKGTVGIIPIKFRIEKGYSPIGELTTLERAKISPVLLKQFLSLGVIKPVEVLVNVFDDKLILPELRGFEILKDYRPALAQVFARISNLATLASLVQLGNILYVYENRKWRLLSETFQEVIGQNLAQRTGYIGTGTTIMILDDGGHVLNGLGGDIPNNGVIDLTVPIFGCTAVDTPDGCRIVHEENPMYADPYKWSHATNVAIRIVETAPGVDIIAYDCGFQGTIDGDALSTAFQWALNHRIEYNIVAVNMSFGTSPTNDMPGGPYSREDCPTGDDWNFQRLRAAGIVPIAAAGNDGMWQEYNVDFSGISHPACSPYVVSVGGTSYGPYYDPKKIWSESDRAPFLDLLAPACVTYPLPGNCGTSIAAPTVTGAWAILHAAKPNLSINEILDLLKSTGYKVYDEKSHLTFPLIQIDDALLAAGLPLVVYSNGPSTQSGGSAVGNSISADDFILNKARNITGASASVSDGPDQNKQWDGTVEWWLLSNNGNLPVKLIASGIGVNVEQKNLKLDPSGRRHFIIHFGFGTVIPLQADKTYWLALHMQTGYSRVSVFWDNTSSTALNQGREGGELFRGVPSFPSASSYDKAFSIWAK